MSEQVVHPVPREWAENALIDADTYAEKYRRSIDDPDGFWREEARRIDWIKPFTQVKDTSFEADTFGIRWFADGTLNLSANCLDRHLATRGDQTAIIWEPDDPRTPGRTLTYRQLHEATCKFANLLKAEGVRRGDRVTIYLPMVPEAPVNAPASCPNNSLSSNSEGIAAVLSAMKGLRERGDSRCRARATSSLPVPVSPVTSTFSGAAATRPMARNSACMRGESPSSCMASPCDAACGTVPADAWAGRASGSARAASATAWSRSKGFDRNSCAPPRKAPAVLARSV